MAALNGMCEETECDAIVTYLHGSRVIPVKDDRVVTVIYGP